MSALTLLALLATVNGYVWPSPKLDALETRRWDQDDQINIMASFVLPCDFFLFSEEFPNSGRSNAADWIRTAYHDMATHDVEDGTGGLDASIRFKEEQARPENVGTGFKNTMDIVGTFTNRYISHADNLAIALVVAIETCNGPQIAFRGGRVDAVVPNNPGVPEPQQDLESHIASFARQGFTKTEMIGLVACGHSFGGVQHEQFPDIVPDLNDPENNLLSVAHFDTTNTNFDNNVVTEYLESTTTNPLIVAKNDTFNSDKRIFGSDGNATMLSFGNSPNLFTATCADLFARMIDTVPRGVELSEVINPLPVRPDLVEIVLMGDKLGLSGTVRVFNSSKENAPVVRVLWTDRAGVNNPANNVETVFDRVSKSMAGRIINNWYAFKGTSITPEFIPLDPEAGVLSMSFTVDGKLEDQGGIGFAVDDRIVFSQSSCIISDSPFLARFDVGVRNGVEPTRLYAELQVRDETNRTIVQETDIKRPAQPVVANSAYSVWSVELNDDSTDQLAGFAIGAEIDGVTISTGVTHFLVALNPCDPKSTESPPSTESPKSTESLGSRRG
ncbi:heme peroxidase [Mycena rebaudengoi]|nr:heme peroxidase [Mycena rebaudengoi]